MLDSRRMGGAWVPGQLWERLEIGRAIRRVAAGRRLDGEAAERVIFSLVAQRALEPGSKLAAARWVAGRVAVEGCPGFSEDALCWLALLLARVARRQQHPASRNRVMIPVNFLRTRHETYRDHEIAATPPVAKRVSGVRRLVRFFALYPACHGCKHPPPARPPHAPGPGGAPGSAGQGVLDGGHDFRRFRFGPRPEPADLTGG